MFASSTKSHFIRRNVISNAITILSVLYIAIGVIFTLYLVRFSFEAGAPIFLFFFLFPGTALLIPACYFTEKDEHWLYLLVNSAILLISILYSGFIFLAIN